WHTEKADQISVILTQCGCAYVAFFRRRANRLAAVAETFDERFQRLPRRSPTIIQSIEFDQEILKILLPTHDFIDCDSVVMLSLSARSRQPGQKHAALRSVNDFAHRPVDRFVIVGSSILRLPVRHGSVSERKVDSKHSAT